MSVNISDRKKSKRVARAACQGGTNALVIKHSGSQQRTCHEANDEEDDSCRYGCLGLGDCVSACKFSAMKINERGIVEIDEDKCIGCGLCAKVCPRQLLKVVEREKSIFIRCNAPGYGKDKRKFCRTACIGCTNCQIHCPNGAISIINGLAVIDYEVCNSCGNCLDCCPACLDYSKVIGTLQRLE